MSNGRAGVLMRWLLLCAALLAASPTVEAHGILQRSSPRANAVLPAAPAEVLLEFNEAIDPRFSHMEVVHPDGRSSRGGVARADGRGLALALDETASGVYTVRWRVLSAVDGHTATGAFLFAVGERAVVPRAPAGQSGLPPVAVIAARWLTYLAALLLAGTVIFDALSFRWTLSRLDPSLAVTLAAPTAARLARLRITAGVVLLGGLLAEFAAQATELLGGGLGTVLRSDVASALLVQTRLGWSVLLRAYAGVLLLLPGSPSWRIFRAAALVWLLVLIPVVVFLGGPSALASSHVALIVLVASVYGLAAVIAARIIPVIPDVRVPEGRWAGLGAAGLMLAGFTLMSHAGGRGGVLALFDWLHLTAAATWLGGLPALLIVLRATPAEARPRLGAILVPRVSALSGLSLLVMVLTGMAQSWTFVASLRGLLGTLYGRSLVFKLSLVAIVAGLGALNRFVFRPRIAMRDGQALDRFRRSVTVEVSLAVLILLAVAALALMPPAAESTRRSEEGGLLYAADIEPSPLRVRVTPARPGLNEIEVGDGVASVRLRHLPSGTEAQVVPERGARRTTGTLELAAGWWEIVVTSGGQETTFPLLLGAWPQTSDPAAVRFLAQTSRAMRRVRTWREVEQITDGSGHAIETVFEAVRPDRLRYRTSSGSEAVILGAERYARSRGGAWDRDRLPQPIALDGPYVQYLADAQGVTFGRTEPCGAEACRLVFWTLSGNAHFAARIGVRTSRIYRVEMVAPQHYMTSRATDLDAPVTIKPPQ